MWFYLAIGTQKGRGSIMVRWFFHPDGDPNPSQLIIAMQGSRGMSVWRGAFDQQLQGYPLLHRPLRYIDNHLHTVRRHLHRSCP